MRYSRCHLQILWNFAQLNLIDTSILWWGERDVQVRVLADLAAAGLGGPAQRHPATEHGQAT